jgi:HlyD family secretion protein
VVAQRQAELNAAQRRFARSESLATRGGASQQQLDDDRAEMLSGQAGVVAATAQVASALAGIEAAKSQVIEAKSAVDAALAVIKRIEADLNDSVLKAPRNGRVQYRIAELGEVLPAGGAVLNMVDLSDVYMTFFLPTREAGRVAMGQEVRLVLDALPQYVIPAKVTYVASVAQFTPKTVETEVEREKLMFRVKAHIAPDLLKEHITQVKTGLPGMAYLRLDPEAEWPDDLQITVPQ